MERRSPQRRGARRVPTVLLLAATCLAPAVAAQGDARSEALPLLVVGDYHMAQGALVAQLLCLLRAAGHDAFGTKVGEVHSHIVDEWERGRAGPVIAGDPDASFGPRPPPPLAGHPALLERLAAAVAEPAPELVRLHRDRATKRTLVIGSDREASEADHRAAKRYEAWHRALADWHAARLRGVVPQVVVVACTPPGRKQPAEASATAITGFRDLCHQHGARPVFAATVKWRLEVDPERRSQAVARRREALAAELDQYRRWRDEFGIVVAPINLAWDLALEAAEAGRLDFIGCHDGSGHYGERSAYLSACVLIAAITGEDPAALPPLADLDPRFAGLEASPSAEECRQLRAIAWTAWQRWRDDSGEQKP